MQDHALHATLRSFSDERAHLDPRTGRDSYGCAAAASCVPLSSCSASEPDAELLALLSGSFRAAPGDGERRARLRSGILLALDLPSTIRVALCPSGTDVVYLASALCLPRDAPLHSVLVGPDEVGRGTASAAAGRHFTACPPRPGAMVARGAALRGWPIARTEVSAVHLRDLAGTPRSEEAVSEQVRVQVRAAIDRGRRVLLHINGGSKTGLLGPSIACCAALFGEFGDDVRFLVDAAQGRMPRAAMADWLALGAMVLFTGSKFFGAPPFCGALLLPSALSPAESAAPLGLRDYLDVHALGPEPAPLVVAGPPWENPGLVLRWELGLLSMRRYFALPMSDRTAVGAGLAEAIAATLGRDLAIRLIGKGPARPEDIVTFEVLRTAGEALSDAALRRLQRALCEDGFLLGQPVQLGTCTSALRLSLSAPLCVRLSAMADKGRTWLRATLSELGARLRVRREEVP